MQQQVSIPTFRIIPDVLKNGSTIYPHRFGLPRAPAAFDNDKAQTKTWAKDSTSILSAELQLQLEGSTRPERERDFQRSLNGKVSVQRVYLNKTILGVNDRLIWVLTRVAEEKPSPTSSLCTIMPSGGVGGHARRGNKGKQKIQFVRTIGRRTLLLQSRSERAKPPPLPSESSRAQPRDM
jgi:hypothetical protein